MSEISKQFIFGMLTLFALIYFLVFIFDTSQHFIDIAIATANQTKELVADERNIIHSITQEQRETWIANLEDPTLAAAGIIIVRDISVFIVSLILFGNMWHHFRNAYKA
jgi:hypothetical protein